MSSQVCQLDAELASAYLQGDGATNPLADALRARRGLVFAASGDIYLGAYPDDPATLAVRLVAAPDQAVTALELALPLLRAATPDPILVDRARATLESRYRSDWLAGRELAKAVMAWTLAGADGDPRLDRFGRIRALGAADLAAVFAEITAAPLIIQISGDASQLDLARLRALGDVTVMTPADLWRAPRSR